MGRPAPRKALSSWRAWGSSMFSRAMEHNLAEMAEVLRGEVRGTGGHVLDLGCWDAENYVRYAPEQGCLFGVEAAADAAKRARARGILMVRGDLNGGLPWRDAAFDVVTSNQVIEHLADTDTFVSECCRVVRPGGLVVTSTENLASWHNIAALTLGWQAFSLTNVSRVATGLGNPLANLRGDEPREPGWEHVRIFSYRGLRELMIAHGLEEVKIMAAGYYPLPSAVARADPRHAAFITAVGRRPVHA